MNHNSVLSVEVPSPIKSEKKKVNVFHKNTLYLGPTKGPEILKATTLF